MLLPTLLLLQLIAVPLPWDARVVVVGRMHAREQGVPAVARELASLGWGAGPARVIEPGESAGELEGGWLLILPDLSGPPRDECDRTGEGGLDLNRDFPAGWRALSEPETPTGPGPLSSPVSREVWAWLRAVDPTTVLALHQGELAVYSPWDGSVHPPPPTLDGCAALALLDPSHWSGAACGQAGWVSGYLAPGTVIDSAAALLPSVSVALTIELGGDPSATACRDVFRATVPAATLVPLVRAIGPQGSRR
jgi:hypothetical protein